MSQTGAEGDVTFALTRDDLAWFNGWILRHVPSQRARYLLSFLSVPAVALITLWQADFNIEVFFWATVPIIVFGSLFMAWSWRHAGTQQVRVAPWLLEPQRISLNPGRLRNITTVMTTEAEWARVQAIVNTQDYVLCFVTERTAFIVPKRAFAYPSEADAFYEIARQYWAEARSAGDQHGRG